MVGDVRLNLDFGNDEEKKKRTSEKIKDASKRKKQALETMDEAWTRILTNPKLTDNDKDKLQQVKNAMGRKLIGREEGKEGRAFSKAEGLRLYKELLAIEREDKLKELVANKPDNYILVSDDVTFQQLKDEMKSSTLAAFDIETYGEENSEDALNPYKGKVAGFSFSNGKYNFYLPLNHKEKTPLNRKKDREIMNELQPLFEHLKLVMHNAPFDCKWIWVHYGIDLTKSLYADTRIMSFCLDENRSHRLKDLATDWLGVKSDTFDVLFDKVPFNEIGLEIAEAYASKDTELTLKLFHWINNWFNKKEDLKKIGKLVFDIEMPVQREFIKADLRGIGFDRTRAIELDKKLEIEEIELKEKIKTLLNVPLGNDENGEELFNLGSPAQLSKVLYEELKLSNLDKGSTGVKTLKKIKSEHPSIPLILEFRELSKLRSSFTQALPRQVLNGRIFASFNTLGAKTGRFTCNSPNLQQIPSKRPEIRKLFTSDKDRILISIDYSQIELRVLAHLAGEEVLIDAFNTGKDIHSTTAAMISDGKYTYDDIENNKDTEGHECQKLRKQAKVVNFGLIYGMSEKGLSETLGITRAEAAIIIENYFKNYAGIGGYMESQHEFVKKHGYVLDIFGRKRRLHEEVKSGDQFKLFGALRQAGNFPIQASAGSMLKKAIVDLQSVLPSMDTFISLQIHDELVFNAPANLSKENLMKIKETMEQAVKLCVPVRCDVEIQPERWSDFVSIEEYYGG